MSGSPFRGFPQSLGVPSSLPSATENLRAVPPLRNPRSI